MRREVTGWLFQTSLWFPPQLSSRSLSGHPPVAAFCGGGGCLYDQIRSESFGLQPDESLIIQTPSGL